MSSRLPYVSAPSNFTNEIVLMQLKSFMKLFPLSRTVHDCMLAVCAEEKCAPSDKNFNHRPSSGAGQFQQCGSNMLRLRSSVCCCIILINAGGYERWVDMENSALSCCISRMTSLRQCSSCNSTSARPTQQARRGMKEQRKKMMQNYSRANIC